MTKNQGELPSLDFSTQIELTLEGISGAGKTTLMRDVIVPALNKAGYDTMWFGDKCLIDRAGNIYPR